MTDLTIDGRRIAADDPPYVIAEMSANHLRDLDRAKALVRAAKEAGADAVKVQTFTPDTLTIDADADAFRIERGTLWDGRTLYDLYREAAMPWEWHAPLFELGAAVGITVFSTAYDASAVDFLESLGVPAYKVASFEVVDLELVERVAATGKPVILSTGMATVEEIDDAVRVARAAGAAELALLRCNSAYPALPEEMDLATIPAMAERWEVPVGLSDHTTRIATAAAAVALGARIVEKHFTLLRDDGGPDAAFSLEPDELHALVDAVREAAVAVGSVRFGPTPREEASIMFRRSLFAVADIEQGETLTRDNVRSIRPGKGLPPKHLGDVLAMRARVRIPRGTPLAWDLLERI